MALLNDYVGAFGANEDDDAAFVNIQSRPVRIVYAPDCPLTDDDISQIHAIRRGMMQRGFTPLAVHSPWSLACGKPMRGKVPMGKGWQEGHPEWRLFSKQPAWSRAGANTGLLLGVASVPVQAIDIDIDAAEAVRAVLRIVKHFAPDAILRYRATAPRVLLLARCEPGATKKRLQGVHGAVERLGHGQQCIVHGWHPSGAKLAWHRDRAPWSVNAADLPMVPEDQVAALMNAIRESGTLGSQLPPLRGHDHSVNGGWEINSPGSYRPDLSADFREHLAREGDMPQAVSTMLRAKGEKRTDRHDALIVLAGSLVAKGWEPTAVEALLVEGANANFGDGDWSKEVQAAVKHAATRRADKAGRIQLPAGPTSQGVETAKGSGLPAGALSLNKGEVAISLDAPPPRRWVVEGLLLAGKAAVLAGFGGVSKTQLAFHLATAIASGTAFANRQVQRGHVLMLLGEEDREEVSRRFGAIARHQGLSAMEVEELRENVRAFPLMGQDVRLMAMNYGQAIATQTHDEIIAAIREYGDVRLLVLDHLALLHGGDFNAREDATVTMRVINDICHQTGVAALVLAHTPKAALSKDASDASMVAGSTAFVDQARAAMVLATMRDEEAKAYVLNGADRESYVSLKVVKSNYGPTGDVVWFERIPFDGVGLLKPTHLTPKMARGPVVLREKVMEFVRGNPGQYSKTKLRDTQAGATKAPFYASKGDVEAAIEELLKAGQLVSRPPTDDERRRFAHDPRTKQVLATP